jgi:hypothetical protein
LMRVEIWAQSGRSNRSRREFNIWTKKKLLKKKSIANAHHRKVRDLRSFDMPRSLSRTFIHT